MDDMIYLSFSFSRLVDRVITRIQLSSQHRSKKATCLDLISYKLHSVIPQEIGRLKRQTSSSCHLDQQPLF